MKYIIRLLVYPFVLGIFLASRIRDLFRFSYLWFLHGGEFLVYKQSDEPKIFADTIDKILNENRGTAQSEQGKYGNNKSKI